MTLALLLAPLVFLLLFDAPCCAAAALYLLHRNVLIAHHRLVLVFALCLARSHRRSLLGAVDALAAHDAVAVALERSSGLSATAARAVAVPPDTP